MLCTQANNKNGSAGVTLTLTDFPRGWLAVIEGMKERRCLTLTEHRPDLILAMRQSYGRMSHRGSGQRGEGNYSHASIGRQLGSFPELQNSAKDVALLMDGWYE